MPTARTVAPWWRRYSRRPRGVVVVLAVLGLETAIAAWLWNGGQWR